MFSNTTDLFIDGRALGHRGPSQQCRLQAELGMTMTRLPTAR